jgi:hypothetical protein
VLAGVLSSQRTNDASIIIPFIVGIRQPISLYLNNQHFLKVYTFIIFNSYYKGIILNNAYFALNSKKNMKFLILTLMLLAKTTVFAQTCKVDVDELKGTYEGECKNGKAEGIGIAKGTADSYQGQFTKGKPNGRGTYTWADGHYYTGEWKSGIKEGQGEMHYKTTSGADSMITGTWKKDKYVVDDKPYQIFLQTQNIAKLEVISTTANNDQILIEISNTSAGLGGMLGSSTKPMPVSDVQLLEGNYQNVTQTSTANKSVMRIINPVFPLRIKLSFQTEALDIKFKENKNWSIRLNVNM